MDRAILYRRGLAELLHGSHSSGIEHRRGPLMQPSIAPLPSIEIVADDSLGTWRERPRPRTRRYSILRKWQATRRYFEPDPHVYILDNRTIVGHSHTLAMMQAAIERQWVTTP